MMPGLSGPFHTYRISHVPKYLVWTLRNLGSFSQFSRFSPFVAQNAYVIQSHVRSNSLGSASIFLKSLSLGAQPHLNCNPSISSSAFTSAASINSIPQSIQDVLRVIHQGFRNLEVGVSDTAQILEMLNQVINAINALPRRSTDDLPMRVFMHPTLLSFLEDPVMKSIRRFTPDDVMKVCLIVTRAERLGITTLRDLLKQSLEGLIDKGEARRKLRESDGVQEKEKKSGNTKDEVAEAAGGDSSSIAGLSVSKYCQLPIMLSLCHQSEILELEFIQRVIHWMADVLVGAEAQLCQATFMDLECFIIGLSHFDTVPDNLTLAAMNQLERSLQTINRGSLSESHSATTATTQQTVQHILHNRQVSNICLGLSRLCRDFSHPVFALLFSQMTGIASTLTPRSICDLLLAMTNMAAVTGKPIASVNLVVRLAEAISARCQFFGVLEAQQILHCLFELDIESALESKVVADLFRTALHDVKLALSAEASSKPDVEDPQSDQRGLSYIERSNRDDAATTPNKLLLTLLLRSNPEEAFDCVAPVLRLPDDAAVSSELKGLAEHLRQRVKSNRASQLEAERPICSAVLQVL